MMDITKRQIAAIQRALDTLAEPGQVVEVRILNIDGRRQRVDSGYFDDFTLLAQAVTTYAGRAEGVYVTLNPVNPALLARAANRIKSWSSLTTTDNDIVKRGWLPIDIDPVRPSGISSTKAEHEAAHARALAIQHWLSDLGWPDPLYADSGNGAHLLYRINLPNDGASATLVQGCLQAIATEHDDDVVKIDVGNYNAARIWKLYFTVTAKGDSTPQRPHRWSRILSTDDSIAVVATDQLDKLAVLATPQPGPESGCGSAGRFDVDGWLSTHGIQAQRSRWKDGWRWKLADCPFSAAHTDGAYVVQFASGAISAGCHHNSCQGKGWQDLRALVEESDGVPADEAPLTNLEQLLQDELRDAIDQLGAELKQEIRSQFEAFST